MKYKPLQLLFLLIIACILIEILFKLKHTTIENNKVKAPTPSSTIKSIKENAVTFYKNVDKAVKSREKWSNELFKFLESELLKFSSKDSKEKEYVYGHNRFNSVGPPLLECIILPLETYGKGDEEKRACALKLKSNGKQCIIISFGSNNQWGFEVEVFNALPNCRIETFDCTIDASTKPPENIASRTTFHHVCIGDSDYVSEQGHVFKSWTTILDMIQCSENPLYLKMDIEGYEFQVLKNIIDTGINLPDEIAFEVHYDTDIAALNPTNQYKSSAELAVFFEYMYRSGQYLLIDRRDNHLCLHCTELLMGRVTASRTTDVQQA